MSGAGPDRHHTTTTRNMHLLLVVRERHEAQHFHTVHVLWLAQWVELRMHVMCWLGGVRECVVCCCVASLLRPVAVFVCL